MAYPYRKEPDLEITGAAMTALYNNFQQTEVLEAAGVQQPGELDPDAYYSADEFTDLLAGWLATPGAVTNLVSIGMAMIYHMEMPDEMLDAAPEEKLLMLGELHMQHHRGAGAGGYAAEMVEDKHIVYRQNTVWPDDMIYGYIYGAAQRFLTRRFVLRYGDEEKRQELGGDTTVLHLTWE